jgi:two-component system, NarL family, invasion response regulator UvrY
VPHELCRALRKVCSGGKYITPTLAEQLAAEVQSSGRPAHESLSNREYQVMLLIVAGKVPKEIGDEPLFEHQNRGHSPHPNPRKVEAEE